MESRILALVGSYRKQGVTDSAVDALVTQMERHGHRVDKRYLLDTALNFCSNCRTCMQSPGEARGRCVIDDGLEPLLEAVERADALLLAAPTNLGDVNALTRQFMERCAGFAYWPWGAKAPVMRRRSRPHKPALLITASGAPAPLGRLFFGSLRSLARLSGILGFRTAGRLWVGGINRAEVSLSPGTQHRIERLALRLHEQLTAER